MLLVLRVQMVFSDWKAQLLGEKERFGSAVLALRVGLLISTVLLEALLVDYHRFFFRSAKQLFGTTVMPGRYALLVGRDVLLCAVHPFIGARRRRTPLPPPRRRRAHLPSLPPRALAAPEESPPTPHRRRALVCRRWPAP